MADLEDILNPPSQHLKAQILVVLREDEGRLEHNVKLLETWMSHQSHLPKNYEKQLLTTFLRGCKHNVQRTKQKLERYFMSRTFEEGLLRNRVMTVEGDLVISKNGYVCPLPEMTADGYRVILKTIISKKDFIMNVHQFVRYELMMYDFRLHHETLWAGDIFVCDSRNLNSSYVMKILCPDFWKLLDMMQNAFPILMKQMHVITTNSMIVKVTNATKQMLSDKLAKRFYIHRNMDSVFKVIPQRLFPSDYGGEKKSTREIVEQWNKKYVELEGWFQNLDEVKVTGPIRKEFEQKFSDVFGVEGSFRQLNLD